MSTLVVLLPLPAAGPASEFEYVLTADGQSVLGHASAAAALLPAPTGAAAEVVAVVPAGALSWHLIELPKGMTASSPRLRAVIEGLLEEHLLDDAQALHFALQPQARAGDPVWVAACDRAWLRAALQALEGAQRPVSRIVPEFAPQGPTVLHAIGDARQPLLVAAGDAGVITLPLTPQGVALLPELAPDAVPLAEPAVVALAEQALQRKFELQQAPLRWLQAARSDWDLAQLEFASGGRARLFKSVAASAADLWRAPQWRPARWGAVLLIVANLLGLNAWAWKERASLERKREAVRSTLTQTFPQVKVVVDAPVQMEREVAALRQATGAASGRDLESLLGALATAQPPRPPSGLEYSGGELRVRGLGLVPDEARRLSAALQGQGYAAALQGDVLVIRTEGAR